MGACEAYESAEGYDYNEEFGKIVRRLEEEYGNDGYNGTLSTCGLTGHHVLAEKYSKKSEKLAEEYMKNHEPRKWEAYCLDLGVTGYLLREVKRKATHKKPPMYRTQYVIENLDDDTPYWKRYAFDIKEQADDKAKRLMLDDGVKRQVVKQRVLIDGTETVTDFTITEKRYKTRPHPKDMSGKSIKEIHKYVYFGMAAE